MLKLGGDWSSHWHNLGWFIGPFSFLPGIPLALIFLGLVFTNEIPSNYKPLVLVSVLLSRVRNMVIYFVTTSTKSELL